MNVFLLLSILVNSCGGWINIQEDHSEEGEAKEWLDYV